MFVKKEKTIFGKKPHLISSRNQAMQSLWGPYTWCVERMLYSNPHFAQTWNHHAYGSFMQRASDKLGFHWAVNVDATAWDAHISKELLLVEQYVFRGLLGVHCPPVELFEALSHGDCRYRNGRHIRLHNQRFSGDMHTSLGNGILNYIIIQAMLIDMGLDETHYDFAVKGDDSDLRLLRSVDVGYVRAFFARCGHIAKVRQCFGEDAEFASVIYLQTKDGWEGFRLPYKTLFRAPFSVGKLSTVQARRRAMAIAECELVENSGCPVIGSLAMYWHRTASAFTQACDFNSDLDFRFKNAVRRAAPDDVCRSSFERVIGVSVSMQLEMESLLDKLVVGEPIPSHPGWGIIFTAFNDLRDYMDSCILEGSWA